MFVHGYCGSERVWAPLRAALTAAGFNCLISLCYNAVTSDVRDVADRLVDESRRALQATGAGKVHLIGHSLGGLVVREAVQRRGLAVADRYRRHDRHSARRDVGGPFRARTVRPCRCDRDRTS